MMRRGYAAGRMVSPSVVPMGSFNPAQPSIAGLILAEARNLKQITDSKLGRNTMKQVNETLEVEWDQGLSIQEHEGFTRFEAGEDIAIDTSDEDGALALKIYINVNHGEDDLEVIGYLNIDDAEDARTLANAILAPFS